MFLCACYCWKIGYIRSHEYQESFELWQNWFFDLGKNISYLWPFLGMILNKEVMKNSSKQSVRFDNLFWRVFFGVPNSQVFATHCKIRYFLHERFLNGSWRQKWIFLLLERQGICKLFEIVLLWVLITPNCVFWYSTLVFVPLDLWRQQFLSLVTRSLLHFLLCYWKRETNGFLFSFTFVQSLKPAFDKLEQHREP